MTAIQLQDRALLKLLLLEVLEERRDLFKQLLKEILEEQDVLAPAQTERRKKIEAFVREDFNQYKEGFKALA